MERFDVVVVGAGHAGIEAALAAARIGRRTACVTLRLDRIGHLPCNCSIGGPAKGHLAREVDALGGQMGLTADRATTHIRRVGTGKGPAVQTVRAHVCKRLYPDLMRRTMASEPNLTLIEGTVERVETRDGRVVGVRIAPEPGGEPALVETRAVVLTTGTFLNGLCHRGREKTVAARHGDEAVRGLSDFLADIGVRLRRFKTGTTPRVRLSSLKLDGLECLPSEDDAGAISFLNDRPPVDRPRYGCWQTRTNPATHAVLGDNLHRSPMFSGQIEGVGPRYCPSVEDKIVRFSGKDSHPIFLEIEEWDGESVYVQGFSTSMPTDVQAAALRTIAGLEEVDVLRYGYAVEYDVADPTQLDANLMSKLVQGLFLAGQLNGTSGYEEAAGQGIAAGIQAARYAANLPPVPFPRDASFLGVMIDDLVTKGVEDPYRMLTARAEHRLLLRHDNADLRLTPLSREVGLCSESRWERFEAKREAIARGRRSLDEHWVSTKHNPVLGSMGQPSVPTKTTFFELLRRPGFSLEDALSLAGRLGIDLGIESAPSGGRPPGLAGEVWDQLALAAKYDGYLQQQERAADQARRLETMPIPPEFDFSALVGLSCESREKLGRIRPSTIGQASRIPGVRPSDIALLVGHLRPIPAGPRLPAQFGSARR
ncbi:MAG: tRNA uridine-5-carboxymethylaminomethyl(34) synthesis enzyme MnmG [Fimbriimonadaceae bacterium]